MTRTITVLGEQQTIESIRAEGTSMLDAHDPEKQAETAPDQAFPHRCMHCHYTRHPCDAYLSAAVIIALCDEIDPPEDDRPDPDDPEHTHDYVPVLAGPSGEDVAYCCEECGDCVDVTTLAGGNMPGASDE